MASSCPTAIPSGLAAISLPSPSSPSPPPRSLSKQARFGFSTRRWRRSTMSSDRSLPPVPDRRVVLGCGSAYVDFLAAVASYPKPDDKIRSTSLKVQGGGNAANASTCAARLGLNPRLITKVADDAQGRGILAELEADGVDTSFLVVSKEGNSPFTYIIVDDQTKTRTCIHTPGYPPMVPHDLSRTNLLSAIDGARIVYFDGRLYETALVVAQEAVRRKIPILIDAERPREGLDDLLKLADYAVCSARFPQAWTDAPSVASALVSVMLRLPNLKFVIVTLGGEGSIMLERSTEVQSVSQLKAKGIGTLHGRLLLGTAEKIPPQEIIDTTGAGDAFIGATLYAICADMLPEKLLPFAAQVAAANCRALGARTSLPYRTDPRLVPFLN